jgi:glycosyltransferase involved in cell wall biosynthesis
MAAPLVTLLVGSTQEETALSEWMSLLHRDRRWEVVLLTITDSLPPEETEGLKVIRCTPGANLMERMYQGFEVATGTYLFPCDHLTDESLSFVRKAIWHLERNREVGIVVAKETGQAEWLTEPSLVAEGSCVGLSVYRRELWASYRGQGESLGPIHGLFGWALERGWKVLALTEPMLAGKTKEMAPQVRSLQNALTERIVRILPLPCVRMLKRIRQSICKADKPLPQPLPCPSAVAALRPLVRDERIGVLIFLPWLKVGGVERMFLDLLKGLDRSQFRAHLVTTLPNEHPWAYQFRPYVEELVHLEQLVLTEQEQVDFLSDYLEAHEIGCVHMSHSQWAYRFTPVLKASRLDIRIFDTLHIEEPHEAWDYFRYSQPFRQMLDRRVVVTSSLAERLVEVYGEERDRIEVIANGIDWEGLDTIRRMAPTEGREEVVFVGRFVEQKQPHLFVEIAARLLEHEPGTRFLMIGDGELLPNIREQIEKKGLTDRIQILGRRDDVLHLLAARARVLVAPSLTEGLPILGLEAMALGVPVVAADVPGWADLIASGQDGYLVPQKDVEAYVQTVLHVLHGNDVEQLIRRAREKIYAHFTARTMVKQYQDLYRSVGDRSASRKGSQC